MKHKMFNRIAKSIGEKQIILTSKVPQGYKINANMSVLETNGKIKTRESSGLLCRYAERREY
jgi:hypothetical protein